MPRREVRFTARQDERLRADAKAANMPIPDFIRFKVLGAPPGQQRKLARRERAIRERGRSAAADALENGHNPPASPEPAAPELPTAVQLSNRMRMTVHQAQQYLDNGMVEVLDGRLFVSGTEIP